MNLRLAELPEPLQAHRPLQPAALQCQDPVDSSPNPAADELDVTSSGQANTTSETCGILQSLTTQLPGQLHGEVLR